MGDARPLPRRRRPRPHLGDTGPEHLGCRWLMRASPGRRDGRAHTAEEEAHALAPVGCSNIFRKH